MPLKRAVILCSALAAPLAMTVPVPAQAQTDPLIGQVMLFAPTKCPRGWAKADGSLLTISDHQSLFALIGNLYGGDGQSDFALPDLRGRAPIAAGQAPGQPTDYFIGQKAGTESVTLGTDQMPAHNHMVNASNDDGTKGGPGTDYLAVARDEDGDAINLYSEGPPNRQMDAGVISTEGGSTPVDIRSPVLAMTYCIALDGIFPSLQ